MPRNGEVRYRKGEKNLGGGTKKKQEKTKCALDGGKIHIQEKKGKEKKMPRKSDKLEARKGGISEKLT